MRTAATVYANLIVELVQSFPEKDLPVILFALRCCGRNICGTFSNIESRCQDKIGKGLNRQVIVCTTEGEVCIEMAMESLYELTEQYAAVRDMLFDEDVDEQVINDTLESIEGAIEVKADNYAKIIREMNATAAVIKQEEVRLAARRKSLENRSAALKDRLEENMRFIDKKKFKTDLFSFNIQTNGGSAAFTGIG